MKISVATEEKILIAIKHVIKSQRPDIEKIATVKRIIALAEMQERRTQHKELQKIDDIISSAWPWLNPRSEVEGPE